MKRKLDPKQTAAFQAVAERGSFEAAADVLHVSPAAISVRVRNLETTLGYALLERGRPCRTTPAGQTLLRHLRQMHALEETLFAELDGTHQRTLGFTLATNADSLATWLLPALNAAVADLDIALDLVVDDQMHTHRLLNAGRVNACVSALAEPMSGCVALPLGRMRYRLMAAPQFARTHFPDGFTREAARSAPAVIFNDKDALHDEVVGARFGLAAGTYPIHSVPASEAFAQAIRLGLGYGLLPEEQAYAQSECAPLTDLLPDLEHDVPLYWHCWKDQVPRFAELTRRVVAAAQAALIPA